MSAGLGLAGALLGAACATKPPPAGAPPRAAQLPQQKPFLDADGLPTDDSEQDDRVERWVNIEPSRVFAADTRCVNAPLEVRLPVVPIAWAREIRLAIDSPRPLAITVELVDGEGHYIWNSPRLFNATDTPERAAALAALEHCRANGPAPAVAAAPAPAPLPPPPGRAGKKPHRPAIATKGKAPALAPAVKRIRSTEADPVAGLRLAPDDEQRSFWTKIAKSYALSWLVTPERYAKIPSGPFNRYPVIYRSDKPIIVRIWSQDVLDMSGVLVTVGDYKLEPVLDVLHYSKLFERREAASRKNVAERTKFCAEHRRDEECWGISLPNITNSPPPPPPAEVPPPRPSPDHEWIPGSWRWDGRAYVWDAGAWRKLAPLPAPAPIVAVVPPAPEKKPAAPPVTPAPAAAGPPPVVAAPPAPVPAPPTVVPGPPVAAALPPAPAAAPSPPPPPPPGPTSAPPPPIVERAPAAPATAGTIWIAGFWQWDGRAYRWAPGHWQLPPTPTARWRPPTWQARAGTRIYFPGGWIDVR